MLTRYAQEKDTTKKNTSYKQKIIKRPILRQIFRDYFHLSLGNDSYLSALISQL